MGGSSSQPAATLLVGSPHFGIPVAATSEEAQRHALAKISSLLSSKEALEVLCHDLFQSISDDGCGGGVSRSGLRMLTRLVIDGCQVSDPAALHELLDVLAPLSSSGSEGGDDDAPRLGYDGFVCYARCMLRVVDAALRSEVGAAAAGGVTEPPSAGASGLVPPACAPGASAASNATAAVLPEAIPTLGIPIDASLLAKPAMFATASATTPGGSPAGTPAATPSAPRVSTPVLTPAPTPVTTPVMPMVSKIMTPTPSATMTASNAPASLTPSAPSMVHGSTPTGATNGLYGSPIGGARPSRPASPLPVGRSISPSRAVSELRSTTPPRLGVRPPLARRPNLSLEPLPNPAGTSSCSSTARVSVGSGASCTPPPWASGLLQPPRRPPSSAVTSTLAPPSAAATPPAQWVQQPPRRSTLHLSGGDRGRAVECTLAEATRGTSMGSSRPPRSVSPARRASGPLPVGGGALGSGTSNALLLARATPPPSSVMPSLGRSDLSRQSLNGNSLGEGGSLASSASLPELAGYPSSEWQTRCPPAVARCAVRSGSPIRGGSLGGLGSRNGSEASLLPFTFMGTTPSLATPSTVPAAALDLVPGPTTAPSTADAAMGMSGITTAAATRGNFVDAGLWGAGGAVNGSCESTAPAGLSDVPDVLRQHLDRRKAQLQSMQQRLAKLSHECDSLQGMVRATE